MKYGLVLALILCSTSLAFAHGDIDVHYHYFDSKELISKPQPVLWDTLLNKQDQINNAIETNNFEVIKTLAHDLEIYFDSFAAIKVYEPISNSTKKNFIQGSKRIARISEKYLTVIDSGDKKKLVALSKKLDKIIHYFEGILPELKNNNKKKGEKNV